MYNLEQISINAWYFREKDPERIIHLVKEAGFSLCEFAGRQLVNLNDSQLVSLKSCLQKNKVKIVSINAACDMFQFVLGNMIFEIEQFRNRAVKYVKKCLDICVALNVTRLILDIGTTTLYGQSRERQEELLQQSWAQISEYAGQKKIKVALIIVPYRRVINSDDGFYYFDYPREELLNEGRRINKGKIGWVFDVANEMAGRKNMHNFSLAREVRSYLRHGLDVVYLANHSGPMTRTFRRALYHDYLRKGYYSKDDYGELLSILDKAGFHGQISLHLSVKDPDIKELQKERFYLKQILKLTQ